MHKTNCKLRDKGYHYITQIEPCVIVSKYRQQQNRQSLALILGADSFNGFANWKSPDQILDIAHLVVCGRPGFEIDSTIFGDHRVETCGDIAGQHAGGILALTVDAIDCSSSGVRTALEMGNTPRQYLTTKVADYIDEHNLYRKHCD